MQGENTNKSPDGLLSTLKGWLEGATRLRHYQADPVGAMAAMSRDLGPYARIDAGAVRFVHCAEPALITEAMVQKQDAFGRPTGGRNALSLYDRGGLVTSTGDDWKEQRQALAPHFHKSNSGAHFEAIGQGIEAALGRWSKAGRIDLEEDLGRFGFDVIQPFLFGRHLGADGDALRQSIDTLRQGMRKRAMRLFSPPWRIAHIGDPEVRRARALAIRVIGGELDRIMADPDKAGPSMLAALIDPAKLNGPDGKAAREQAIDRVFQLAVGGHATVASAIGFALLDLANHPDQQLILAQEALGWADTKPLPELADVRALAATERAYKESMRLNPPAYAVMRQVETPVELGGLTLEKGTILNIAIAPVQRDPRFWNDPDRYDPSRFTPEAEAARPKGSYIPFGFGPHRCIGGEIAMLEGKALLSCLAKNFVISPAPMTPDAKPDQRLTQGPAPGAAVLIRPRGPIPRPATPPAIIPAETPPAAAPTAGRCPFHKP